MIKQGSKVKVHYTGKYTNDSIFDTSYRDDRSALEFVVGEGQLIKGFEDAVLGMIPGEKKTVQIDPERAYGAINQEMILSVPKNMVPENVEVGQTLSGTLKDGQEVPFMVKEVNDSDVLVDANHPLAGETLVFDIEILEIIE
jgi:FKBP-type peptidyl-prolyl cis-trans isomerase 2